MITSRSLQDLFVCNKVVNIPLKKTRATRAYWVCSKTWLVCEFSANAKLDHLHHNRYNCVRRQQLMSGNHLTFIYSLSMETLLFHILT